MKRDKIYISGPVSSRPLGVAINHFILAEAKLQAQGYRTCNPLKMRLCVWLAQHGHYRLCLLLQLLWMWWTCSCIYLLTDWHTSDGARLERSFARCLGLTALYEQTKRKPSPFSKAAEAFTELGKAFAACGVDDNTIKPKSKKHKKNQVITSKQGQKKETDFGAVNSWLEENVLPMLMEKCANPLEAIYLLTSFTKNASLTIGVAAGQPPKRVIAACKDIFDKKDYNEEALTMMAALMAKKIEKNGGVADLSDAIDSVEEITRKLDEQN